MTRLKSLLNMLLYFLVPILMQFIYTFIYRLVNPDLAQTDFITNATQNLSSLTGMAYMMIPTLIIIILLNYQYLKRKVAYSIFDYKKTIKYGVTGFIVMYGAVIIFSIILQLMQVSVDTAENQAQIDNMIKNMPLFNVILIIGFIVPFLEEIIFRMSLAGLLIKDKVVNYNKPILNWLPYIAMALIFALIHESSFITNFNSDNLINFITYFIPSLCLAIVYKKSQHNILATYIMHIINNVITTLIPYLM